ncbi:50S ribosomal protein L27 [Candidatus Curtissbacteria bacterium RIFCSPHIGHO2_01_FULL_41_44]|uniref:Large ribosomal subunit protein bL27 n=1 Tax=Candidatus Curtissbacteria bacterium RIFCSPLOWO2_01_FULL_42_50 TaxID=1797730 RepID=A0A1F5H371_9BACT|nr:MAG: 50S ribosomal protein L27 [Candidatus Curtissbacteria bacterium RIFCSPHIGHO2_02_FULL_42_58]OGD94577.1 MAG: 50S ribosomal protein L27 [Candidatus Curtissbacteria bacterium RIFCSPHIGHO2_01_FULL_41_44]OGD97959.1 MAG: 50S ribosomal protein L27 [Candidatus Curtissbacteria bacterium RIFCSPHIGHO2_12_FULL_42_33]OGD98610.1 MAG: 50S ribosomal protein L27 [Candidatus Curtissbacteria bacterium RIFCSPLOWO2_01_FULL_42_50]OGE02177.1 MAG: 50S ribosomal protein L27 [Candidatus Curtissbacteria bacterium 
MAHKKGGGATTKNRDSAGKRLGIKVYGGQKAWPGKIIVRQRGTKFFPGQGALIGRDHTIFAVAQGIVKFRKRLGKNFVDIN